MVYQRQGRRSTQNYLQRKNYKEWYTNAKADDQLKIIYNEKKKYINKAKKKMCVYCHMSTKSKVGRSGLIFFFIIIGKTGNSCSRFRNPIPVFDFRNFPVSRHLLKLFYD